MLFYDTHPYNDEPLLMTCLRWLIEGVVFVGFICATLFAVVVIAALTGVI